jgi:phosphoglycolate phosphatase
VPGRIRNVLFDLDGTLTDPAEGIIRCIQHSLQTLNLACPPPAELVSYIGPPLRLSFATLCRSSDVDLVERAVEIFRERFSTVGLFENFVYADVSQTLAQLQSQSYRLFVATSKPQIYAERILQRFALADYFVEIHGNELDGRLDDKAEMIRELLLQHGLSPQETIMVGDRHHDVVAAKRNQVLSLGVTYGYGSRDELTESGADHICDSPLEIVSLIDGLK